jgi:hypothetical protein
MFHGDGVDIRIEIADVLTRPTDLLVLKYAQDSYGVDAAAADALGISSLALPAPGAQLCVDGGARVAARSVLFLGMPAIGEFDYRQVHEFGRRALAGAASVRPAITDMSVTLHGPGFGLDEREAFRAEVAGVAEGIWSGQAPPMLRTVTFVERDPRRADRMGQALAALVPAGRIRRPAPSRSEPASRPTDLLDPVGLDSGDRPHALVAMPFDESFYDVFHYGITKAVNDAGYRCERIDRTAFTGDVVQRMRERIATADFVVADVTGANPNVYLEIGYAWGRDIPTVLVCRDSADLMFDVRGQRCLKYGSIVDLERKLSGELAVLFPGRARRGRAHG